MLSKYIGTMVTAGSEEQRGERRTDRYHVSGHLRLVVEHCEVGTISLAYVYCNLEIPVHRGRGRGKVLSCWIGTRLSIQL